MRKLSLTLLAVLIVTSGFAQSLKLVALEVDTLVKYDLYQHKSAYPKIVNTTADTIWVRAQRTLVDVGENQGTSFCWDACYGNSDNIAINPVRIAPFDTCSNLVVKIEPGGEAYTGSTTVFLYDKDDNTDNLSVTVHFEPLFNTSFGDEFNALEALSNPYPNPARDFTQFNYELPFGVSQAELRVYNLVGREIKRLPIDNSRSKVTLTTEGMTSGVYFVYLVTDQEEITSRKLIIAK